MMWVTEQMDVVFHCYWGDRKRSYIVFRGSQHVMINSVDAKEIREKQTVLIKLRMKIEIKNNILDKEVEDNRKPNERKGARK